MEFLSFLYLFEIIHMLAPLVVFIVCFFLSVKYRNERSIISIILLNVFCFVCALPCGFFLTILGCQFGEYIAVLSLIFSIVVSAFIVPFPLCYIINKFLKKKFTLKTLSYASLSSAALFAFLLILGLLHAGYTDMKEDGLSRGRPLGCYCKISLNLS